MLECERDRSVTVFLRVSKLFYVSEDGSVTVFLRVCKLFRLVRMGV